MDYLVDVSGVDFSGTSLTHGASAVIRAVAPRLTQETGVWLPESVSTTSDGVDWIFYGLVGLSGFFFIGIAIALVYFAIKYRARPGHEAQSSPPGNDALEITWTVVPALICVVLFVVGWHRFMDNAVPPGNALDIQAKAMKWKWQFTHYNGVQDTELHVPVHRSIRLVMTSNDVLHSFFVPVFRIKQDLLPKRYTLVWFKAVKPGVYRLYCAEYCGLDHSQMKTVVVVHEPGDYEAYLQAKYEEQAGLTPVARGQVVYTNYCIACHTVDGTPRVGPSFKGIFGQTHEMTDGAEVQVDENYIRESVLMPQAKIRRGYPPSMPSFQGILTDDDITGVIAYIKSLE